MYTADQLHRLLGAMSQAERSACHIVLATVDEDGTVIHRHVDTIEVVYHNDSINAAQVRLHPGECWEDDDE